MQRNVLLKPHEVSNRLAELGLVESELLEAVRKGMAARFSCTPNHPPAGTWILRVVRDCSWTT